MITIAVRMEIHMDTRMATSWVDRNFGFNLRQRITPEGENGEK
jgi:hypothetical protein